ncbi:hypothetical protein BKA67DRAFT_652974 [Truncatella angustata]|uniref:2EXR domain-containing protein n=1 Tax=Truncatella angustata TaxID=152316 RepID=A0A9P8UWR1_9PEZI|nr:uncharacterized protein BKA67DRAFT_652974 [Truncatella angustata]KAH6659757.1 hypothetical protein BKA67DRAFT_652974 [Truncatella angustata]
MATLECFHLFSLLPSEIRLDIWQHTCCHPRVVEVYYDAVVDECITKTTQPAVLYTCAESRREALRLYKPLFGTISADARIYFHPEQDTLYLPRPTHMGYDDNARDFAQLVTGASDIKNLALDHVNPSIRRPWETYNKYALMQSFPKVMEVYLVLETNTGHDSDERRTKHSFLKLAEPIADARDVCKLLQDVKSSFSYEAGANFGIDQKDKNLPEPPALVLKSKVATDYLRLL